MECTITDTDALSRTFRVVIPASQLEAQLNAKIEEVRPRVQLKGFRAGMVPASHIRKVYGPSIIREIIDEEVQKSTQEAIKQADVRIASEPHLHLESDLEKVAGGKEDLAFHFHVDLMPDFEPADPASIVLERPVTAVKDDQVEEALAGIAKANRTFEDKDGAAADGDAVTIDFLGKLDGEPFDGGAAEGATLTLGSKQFIPGFEEQLIGAKVGDERQLDVTFPEDYPSENLKGRAATFDVKVHAVKAPKETPINDEFAARLGFQNIDEVRDALRQRIQAEHSGQSRAKAKRKLFDLLDAGHAFDLPKGMVDAEFGQIWSQLEQDRQNGRLDDEDAAKSPEDLEKEYRAIAERRVRLGLILAEIGRRNNVEVREDEVAAAVGEQARRFPGQERQVIEFYQKNPGALAQVRAPIYEEKVVDFILELAKVSNVEVSREDLFKDEDEDVAATAAANA
jgi:trigger factor